MGSWQNLLDNGCWGAFSEANIMNVGIEKSTTWEEFLNKIEFLFVFKNIDNSTNTWMIQFFQNFNFLQQLLSLTEFQLFFFCYFDSSCFTCDLVIALSGGRETTITKGVSGFVLIFELMVCTQIEFFCWKFNFFTYWSIEVSSFLEETLEILFGESDEFFFDRLSSDDFFNEVFQDAWELIWHFYLLGGKYSHILNVRHFWKVITYLKL